jgi:PAS domain S-box-containing protein
MSVNLDIPSSSSHDSAADARRSRVTSVLYVEDSAADAELTLRALGRAGLDVRAHRVEDATGMRRALAEDTFDVVISDYALPRFDALSALRVLQESGQDIPFIVVSGAIGEEIAVKMMRAGAHDYILKDDLRRLQPAVEREIADAQSRRARRLAESALRESEERLALAIDATQLGTFDFNPRTGALVWSQYAKRHFGLAADAMVSMDRLWEAIHPDDRPAVRAALMQAFQSRHGGYYTAEYRTIGIEDRVERCLATRGRLLCDADGQPARLVGVSIEVTERVRMEAALRESVEREAEANRVKDQFLANLSHELRTPLNVILGYSRGLTTRPIEPAPADVERVRRTARIIERNATAQLRIVEDLLDVQRITSGRLAADYSRCDLRTLAQGVIDSLMPEITAKKLTVLTDFAPVDSVCDAARMQQVVWNLLGNAIKFTPACGTILFSLGRQQDHAVIRLKDTGEGIPAHFLPHVFDRFRQLDMTSTRRHEGMGLGLAIVKHVVELHGGEILAESDGEGLGATFTVRLPLRPAGASALSAGPAEPI